MKPLPSILYIAHRIPYPPNKGDKIRTFNEIRFLSRFYAIDMVALVDEPEDLKFQAKLESLCRSVYLFPLKKRTAGVRGGLSALAGASISKGYFYLRAAQERISRLLLKKSYRAVICFSSPMAAYLIHHFSKPPDNGPKLIMDFCDVDSEKWYQYGERFNGLKSFIYRIEAARLRKFETKVSQFFDASIFVSRLEADLFIRRVPKARRVHVISNGVDHHFFSPNWQDRQKVTNTDIQPKVFQLMFAGAMDYQANIDAVVWFVTRVLPVIRKKLEGSRVKLQFDIVGRNPSASVLKLGRHNGVRVVGRVKDIRPHYRRASLVVVPLRIARGIQNKVLEAMAMAKPISATSWAVEGIGGESGRHFRIADTEQGFAKTVLELIHDPGSCFQMGRDARAYVEMNFSWEKSLWPLLELIDGKV